MVQSSSSAPQYDRDMAYQSSVEWLEGRLQAMNAVREVIEDPLAAERWRDHPRLGPLARKVARLTLETRFNA